MTTTAIDTPTLRTNLADYAVTKAMKDGRVRSDLVQLDFCGPTPAHNGFKAMVRENKFDAGELAIVTYLQAKAYGKPYVLLPAPISGRFQHHCGGFNIDFGHLHPKDIEGKRVGVRSYAQTTGLWIRGILRHEHGVDLDKVTWMTLIDGHLAEYQDPANCVRLPAGVSIPDMMMKGELAAALLGEDMPKDERVRGEAFSPGDRIRTIVIEVRKDGPRVRIVVSRAHADLVRRLFELEVPEIADGIIEIKRVVREPGYRTKMAVISQDPKIDCIGACVGVRGSRIKAVIDELRGERIDIIRWSDSLETLIMNGLKPATIHLENIFPDVDSHSAVVLVDEDQQSLAIGKKGQNVRLASRLCGWDIDIKTRAEFEADSLVGGGPQAPALEGEAPADAEGGVAFGEATEEIAP